MNKLLRLANFTKMGVFYTSLAAFFVLPLLSASVFAEEKEAAQTFSFKILVSRGNCQIATWITDDQGTFIETVYVTRKTAKKGLGNKGGSLDDGSLEAKYSEQGSRLSTVHVWAYSRGIDYGNGNFYPTGVQPLPDAISSATPKAGEFKWNWNPINILKHGRYFYYVEVNKAFDQNEHNDYSWVRGQPSVVWQGSILVGDKIDNSEAKIIGHGHAAGEDGQINPDITTLTTSLNLIDKVTVSFKP